MDPKNKKSNRKELRDDEALDNDYNEAYDDYDEENEGNLESHGRDEEDDLDDDSSMDEDYLDDYENDDYSDRK